MECLDATRTTRAQDLVETLMLGGDLRLSRVRRWVVGTVLSAFEGAE